MAKRSDHTRFVVCVSNQGYRASLIARRIYRRLEDPQAEAKGLVRIVDESGEDYLFPGRLFVAIELPRAATKAFRAAS